MSSPFFGLVWPGKDEAVAAATRPTSTRLRQRTSTTSPHHFYTGDNVDVLKHLRDAPQAGCGGIDVIYIDPPYNTGRDFIYRDNYRSRREFRAVDHGRWHAEWLSMMYPRLVLARDLLKDSGFICISIGEDEVANLRKVADEIFGEECFAGQLIWKKAGTGKNDSRYAVVEHEYILVYAKSLDNPGFNLDVGAEKSTRYNHEDERGRYSLVRLDSKTLGYLPTLDFPIIGPDGREYWPDQPAGRDKVARWRWGRDKVAEHHDDLVFRRGFVYTKNYESRGARPRSILDGERFGVTRTGRRDVEEALGVRGIFDFPKPVRLVQHLIALCGPSNASVLDFFAGSGTTAQAVFELNADDGGTRSVQLVQIPQPTEKDSAAFRAGYEDLAALCLARFEAAAVAAGASVAVWDVEPTEPTEPTGGTKSI